MEKISVCLIIPPSPFLLDERVFPFLGILKVASVLEQAGHSVEVLDLSKIRNFLDIVEDHARTTNAKHFALTATTPQFPSAVQISKRIRSVRSDARTIIGGTHATLVIAGGRAAEKREHSGGRAERDFIPLQEHFDVVVAGDGEATIFPALEDNAPSIIDGDDRTSPYFLTNETLDATPLPARHLIDLSTYHYTVGGAPATSIIAQLGCPYHCGFCAGRASPMLRNIRMRSNESIVAELVGLHKTYGYTGFMFYDDELNVNPGMVSLMEQITRAQRDLGVSFKLRGFVKSERFTFEQAEALKEAGFSQLLIGFESGSEKILRNIRKIATVDDNTRCIDIAHANGLTVKALMSVGHPGESLETIGDTERWLLDVQPEDFDCTIITPYPGSPYYDEATHFGQMPDGRNIWKYTIEQTARERAQGMQYHDVLYQVEVDYAQEADYYKGDPDDGYVSHVWTDFLSAEELVTRRSNLEQTVRDALGIRFNPSSPAMLYEHSMGQAPGHILRRS